MSVDEGAFLEFGEQVVSVEEVHSVHARGAGGLDVADAVIDIEHTLERVPKPMGQDLEDLWVRLDNAFGTGDNDVVEDRKDLGKDFGQMVDRLGGPIRQGDQPHAAIMECVQDLGRSRDQAP